MHATITKMMLVLPAQKASQDAGEAEAEAEAFDMALGDVPVWAINAAVRRWYRGQYGEGHSYTWQPAPAVLRSLAFLELAKIRRRIRDLESVLNAKAERELPPPSERPSAADITAKLRCLRPMADTPLTKRNIQVEAELERREARHILDRYEAEAQPSVFDLEPDNWNA